MKQPRITIPANRGNRILEGTALLLLISLWTIALISFRTLPDSIPVHFSLKGIPDRFGDRSSIFILPAIATAIVVTLQILIRFPHTFSYPKKVDEHNAEEMYSIATRLIRWMQFGAGASFLVCLIVVLISVKSGHPAYIPFALASALILFLAPIAVSTVKILRVS
ncbi:MAG TPA: DUF1648 domain-containing protein [Spirochaetota bacterium]|nr:DUF1648 domain-containing protein [Spirochaetota bacterium]